MRRFFLIVLAVLIALLSVSACFVFFNSDSLALSGGGGSGVRSSSRPNSSPADSSSNSGSDSSLADISASDSSENSSIVPSDISVDFSETIHFVDGDSVFFVTAYRLLVAENFNYAFRCAYRYDSAGISYLYSDTYYEGVFIRDQRYSVEALFGSEYSDCYLIIFSFDIDEFCSRLDFCASVFTFDYENNYDLNDSSTYVISQEVSCPRSDTYLKGES